MGWNASHALLGALTAFMEKQQLADSNTCRMGCECMLAAAVVLRRQGAAGAAANGSAAVARLGVASIHSPGD